MKELDDEEIQQLLDFKQDIEPLPNVELYKSVFKELQRKPDLNLGNLSLNVITTIQHKKDWNSFYTSIVMIMSIVLIAVIVFILAIDNIDNKIYKQTINMLLHYKIVLAYVVAVVVLVQVIEKKFFNHLISMNHH